MSAGGFFRNVFAKISLESLLQNQVNIEVSYDVVLESGFLNDLTQNVFNQAFGLASPDGVRAFVNDVEVSANINFGVQNAQISPAFGQTFFAGDEFSLAYEFSVSDTVCLHSSGQQAIPATWMNFLTTTQTNFVEVDYVIPLGVNGFANDFEPTLVPESPNVVFQRAADAQLEIFAPYDPVDIGFGEGVASSNLFLLIGNEGFNESLIPLDTCVELEEEEQADLGIFVVSFFVIIIGCVVGLLVIARYANGDQSRRPTNNNTPLHQFPGNPDIILAPNSGGSTVVQAVRESEDETELDAFGAITTINVNIDSSVERQSTNAEEPSTVRQSTFEELL